MVDVEEQRKEDDGVTSSSGVGSGSAAGLVTGGNAGTAGGARKMLPEMPEGWLYPHLIMACAWSPWSGNTPSEWKNLCASGGKPEALKEEDKLDTGSNPLSSPAAMAAAASARKMLNNNGDSSSRRQTEAAAKAEADRLRRAQKDKENMALMKETEVTRKKGVAAMEEINVNAVELNKHMKRMVELREDETNLKKDEAQAAKRARKIESLEKRCHMAGGRDAALTSRLHQLLSEESGDA
ncbi:unnamed protein product [Pylaiella littoralis]